MEIDVLDETGTVIYHIRYSDASSAEPGEVGHGKRYVVYLPSGFDPGRRSDVAGTLNATLADIDFVNEQSDTLDLTLQGQARGKISLSLVDKEMRAKTLVTQYLPSLGLDAVQTEQGGLTLRGLLTALVNQQKVEFLNETAWAWAMLGSPATPQTAEAITTPGPRGKRLVSINAENHTLNAIIHELFHAIASDALADLVGGVVEGMTEYFALQASGLDVRFAQDGGTVFGDNMRALRLALTNGVVTPTQLVRGYFLGETDPLAGLIASWDSLQTQEYPQLVADLLDNQAAHDELDRTMAADETHAVEARRVEPSEQLGICLARWQHAAVQDSLELALCVYTTYFYSVLNKPFRDYRLILKAKSPLIRDLIYDTHSWLMAGFKAAAPVFIRTFRMELKSEWMKDAPIGAEVLFNGFTSTHPTLAGVNSMPYDVRRGAFGDVTLPAVLVFEGVCPVLMPETKYFSGETEYILPAGMKMRVTNKYVLNWYLESDAETNPITVYHLTPTSLFNLNIDLLPFEVAPGRVPPVPANPDQGPRELYVNMDKNGDLDIRAIAT